MPQREPAKVREIVKALKRDNPDWDEERYWKIAWSTYNKMKEENIYLGCYGYLIESDPILGWKRKKKKKSLPSSPAVLPNDIDEDVGVGVAYKDDIIEFFTRTPYPDDNQVHKLAMDLGITSEELEREIYIMFTDLLKLRVYRDE